MTLGRLPTSVVRQTSFITSCPANKAWINTRRLSRASNDHWEFVPSELSGALRSSLYIHTFFARNPNPQSELKNSEFESFTSLWSFTPDPSHKSWPQHFENFRHIQWTISDQNPCVHEGFYRKGWFRRGVYDAHDGHNSHVGVVGIVVLTSDAGLVGDADDAHAIVCVGRDFAGAASAMAILVGEIVARRRIEVLRVHVVRSP